MARLNRGALRVFAGLAALGAAALAPGCDWLKGSGGSQRTSPFLSSLSVNRSSVLCGTEFTVSFRFDDPQGDIYQVLLLLELEGGTAAIDASDIWPEDISRSAGTASFPVTFDCEQPGGRWTITVSVEDDLGHKSNELSGSITLNAAG